jgi:hypothetical protein
MCDFCNGMYNKDEARMYALKHPTYSLSIIVNGKQYIVVSLSSDVNDLIEIDYDINYCPMCGRKLVEE